MYKIPFKNFDEIREVAGGISVDYDFERVKPSLVMAVGNISDVIGEDVYNLAITHYESANYNKEDEEDEKHEGKERPSLHQPTARTPTNPAPQTSAVAVLLLTVVVRRGPA